MAQRTTRRRMIRISAATAGLALLPFGDERAAAANIVTWRGVALGAVATIQLHHPDRTIAEKLIDRSVAEAHRLESIFSLYRPDSVLVALNEHGALAAPPAELVDLLSACQRYSRLTDGAFDPTVQPLWRLCADHFSRADTDPAGPSTEALAESLKRIGHDGVLVNRDRIVLAKRGMQLTLNGIAQGYITDRVIDLLRAGGITQTLVDMGETRCLGAHPSGRPWKVGIADPDQPAHTRETLPIVNQAVATSGAYGFQFDSLGRFNHLFDPKTGESAHAYRSVTVIASTATAADALSTAFSFMTIADIDRVLAAINDGAAYLILQDEQIVVRNQA